MTTITEPGIKGIGQIAVRVTDLRESVAFYRDLLRFRLLMEIPNTAFFDCGGIRLMLTLPEAPEFDHPASIIYYRVEDIDQTHRMLREQGVEFARDPHMIAKMPDHELWMAFFNDPSGNLLALMSEVR